jgi:hypothetical protein
MMMATQITGEESLSKMATITKDEYSPACHCGQNPGGLCGQCWLGEKPIASDSEKR